MTQNLSSEDRSKWPSGILNAEAPYDGPMGLNSISSEHDATPKATESPGHLSLKIKWLAIISTYFVFKILLGDIFSKEQN